MASQAKASTSRAAPKGKQSALSLDEELLANGLKRYGLTPPSWRAPWLASSDNSGTPQLYPTCENQDEDVLSEAVVKAGFTAKMLVSTESFSAHQLIYDKLKSDQILPALSKLATAVAERAALRAPTFGAPAFRLPQRLTVNDQKKEAWVNDLVNPAVPLSKLARSIPHGFRGEKIMEMLCSRQVPIARAVWYVRAVGACEIANMKSRQPNTFSVAQYTRDWTAFVQEFVRKQLAEIAIPELAVDAKTIPVNGKGKGVLLDNELRTAWSARFEYTLSLLDALYEEQLVERDSFLRFLIAQLEASNVGQLAFLVFLVEEYLGEFFLSEPLSARLASACFGRLNEIVAIRDASGAHLEETSSSLTSLVRSIFIALPDAFVACPLWIQYAEQLETMMTSSDLEPSLAATARRDLSDLKLRDEACSESAQDAASLEPDELQMIQILDDIVFPVDLSVVRKTLFHKRRRRQPLSDDLNILFSWATTPDRSGPHRPYAVAALIAMELDDPVASTAKLDVEAAFIRWVDAGLVYDRWAVSNLLAELIRVGVMSYSLYLQRMIARGETEQVKGMPPSVHLHLLRTVPLFGEGGQILAKRRVALVAGALARAESKRLSDSAERELYSVVPELMPGGIGQVGLSDCTALLDAVEKLAKDGSHYILTRQSIPSGVVRLVQSAPVAGASVLSMESHAALIQVYLSVEDLWGLLEYITLLLQTQPSRDLLILLLDNVESNLITWTSMAALPSLAKALLIAHESLRANGRSCRRLVTLLRRIGAAGFMGSEALSQLEQDYQSHSLSLSTTRPQTGPAPVGLQELQSLAIDGSPKACAELATTIWYRYHAYESWGQIVVENVVRLIAFVANSTWAAFLREINERLPSGLEPCIARWIASMPSSSLAQAFGGADGQKLGNLLESLILEGTLSAVGAVSLVVLPAWSSLLFGATTAVSSNTFRKRGDDAKSSASEATWTVPDNHFEDKTVPLHGVEVVASLFGGLIGCDLLRSPSSSKPDLLSRQRADCRRASLYTAAALPDIGRCIAMLAIQQEIWTARADFEKAHIASTLVLHVSSGPAFKMAVARDPQALATSLLDSSVVTSIPAAQAFRPKLLAALLLILKDSSKATPASLVSTEDFDLFLSGLTIWRLAISKVEVQACLERLDLDTTLGDSDKNTALNILACHFLDRVCYGEGHMYLGEQVVRCYRGRASDELVSVAFSRLAEAVDGLGFTASPELHASSLTTVRCSGRLLDILLESNCATSRPEPLTQLLTAIKASLEGLLDVNTAPQREVVLHLALLIRIALRCAPSFVQPQATIPANGVLPVPDWCVLFKECLVLVGRLAATLAKRCYGMDDLSNVLLDTCAHLLFVLTRIGPSLRIPSFQLVLISDFDLDALPSSTVSRLARLFGQYNLIIPVSNPWELVDQADPGPMKSQRYNIGPIDLALFDAKFLESVPTFTALEVAPQSSVMSSGVSERGLQTIFDFEIPTTGFPLAARDFRRTLTGSKVFVSTYDPLGKQKAKDAEAAAAIIATKVAAAAPRPAAPIGKAQAVATASSTTGSSGSINAKRKSAQTEVLELGDSSDEEILAKAPPPKKAKNSSAKSTAKGSAKRKNSRA